MLLSKHIATVNIGNQTEKNLLVPHCSTGYSANALFFLEEEINKAERPYEFLGTEITSIGVLLRHKEADSNKSTMKHEAIGKRISLVLLLMEQFVFIIY